MSIKLSVDEKNDLLEILNAIYGVSLEFERGKARFNEQTVIETEKALAALVECNALMKKLVLGLVGGSALMTSGWLRKILKKLASTLKSDKVKFDGVACRNAIALNRKSAILITLY